MKKLKLTRERRKRFLTALAETGIVTLAAEIAGTSRTRVYELRKADEEFAAAWDEAEEKAADALEAGSLPSCRRRRAGKPLVSAGKVVRDDDGAAACDPAIFRHIADHPC
jgi:hypothetical protein